MKQIIPILFIVVLTASCIGSSDPTPSIKGNYGSWSYGGTTYKGTYSAWAANALTVIADKPHTSGLEAYFSSANPAAGTYTIAPDGGTPNANQVTIALVDSSLPALTYISPEDNPGTVKVSKNGSTITVTVDNIKVKGITADLKADSVVVTGTIVH
jgi:hypothetical protein